MRIVSHSVFGEVLLSATETELTWLADLVAAGEGSLTCESEPAEPGALAAVEVAPATGPGVRIHVDATRRVLVISGDPGARAILADNLNGTTIAQRANLTERSFYRWFADKREVLFGGSEDLEKHLVSAIDATPADTGALPTLLAAFATAPEVFRPREFLRERSAVIAANPPLQERELIKLASISEALAAALLHRGCDQQTARLATDVGMAVLRLTTERWKADERADFAQVLSTSAADLLAVTADGVPNRASTGALQYAGCPVACRACPQEPRGPEDRKPLQHSPHPRTASDNPRRSSLSPPLCRQTDLA
ncbi:MAG: TetR/AcrR family transcriptional regulator [Actinoallomurus sp.]